MAALSAVKVKTATLTAAAADSVTLSQPRDYVEIVHHGNVTNPIFVTIGTTIAAPTAAADDTDVVLPGERARFAAPSSTLSVVVNLISAGAATYTVTLT